MDSARTRRGGTDDRTFLAWSAGVIAVSTAVFTWMATLGRWDLFASRTFSDVFDLQGRALAHGQLTVPTGSLAFEGFVVDGRTVAYFGLFPSLLRLPVLAVTDRYDGRLGTVSMIVAYLIALWACTALIRRVHRLARPDGAWTGTGLAVAIGLVAVLGIGSNLTFLASASWVYHEASMWGAAGVLASFAAIVAHLLDPRPRHVVVAGAWATVAWLSRGSVGLGPSVALGLLALAQLVEHPWLRALAPTPAPAPSPAGPRRWRSAGALLVAAGAGALAFGVVNTAKFGGPTVLPMDKQVASQNPWPTRKAALEAYDGSLFSSKVIPATVAQTVRPDLVAPDGTWPFVRLRSAPPFRLGQPVFDTVEPSTGITVTEPALLALAVVGGVAIVRRRRPQDGSDGGGADGGEPEGDGGEGPVAAAPGLDGLRPLLLGAAVGCSAPFTIAFIAQRYLTDLLPLLVVGAVAAVAAIDRRAARAPLGRGRQVALAALGVAAVAGIGTTLATTWLYQRLEIPPDAAARAAGLRTQVAVAGRVGSPPPFARADDPATPVPTHQALVLGDCDGLYWVEGDGTLAPIEVRAAGGRHRLEVERAELGAEPRTLFAVGPAADRLLVTVTAVDAAQVRVDLERAGVRTPGTPFDLAVGATATLDVVVDPTGRFTSVVHGDGDVVYRPGPPPVGDAATAPAAPGDGTALAAPEGRVTEVPIDVPTCQALVGS